MEKRWERRAASRARTLDFIYRQTGECGCWEWQSHWPFFLQEAASKKYVFYLWNSWHGLCWANGLSTSPCLEWQFPGDKEEPVVSAPHSRAGPELYSQPYADSLADPAEKVCLLQKPSSSPKVKFYSNCRWWKIRHIFSAFLQHPSSVASRNCPTVFLWSLLLLLPYVDN